MTKLCTGNLPFCANEEAAGALSTAYRTMQTLSRVNGRETDTPRGFGAVESSTDDAARAMQRLDGKDYDGRPLEMNEAHGARGSNSHSHR
jgi:outer membrane murein-binding lipoprotein Lpp